MLTADQTPCHCMVQHRRICNSPPVTDHLLHCSLTDDLARELGPQRPRRHLGRSPRHRSRSMHCAQRGHCVSTRPLRQTFGSSATSVCVQRAASRRQMTTQAVLSNQTVAVTGASQGIGLEFVRQLLAKDNTVVAAVRSPGTATALQELQQQHPPTGTGHRKLHITTLDVSNPKSITTWASSLRDKCPGLRHLDVVINNAGVYGGKQDIRKITADEMLAVYTVNTVGPLLIVQQLLEAGLIGSMGGKTLVANVTSKVGSVDDNKSGGSYAYRASKSALNNVNKSLSIDLAADGVSSVLLHPGYVRTRMTNGQGLIDVNESVAGLISVLEGNAGPLNGQWYDFAGKVIPW